MITLDFGDLVVERTPTNESEASLWINAPFRFFVDGYRLIDEPSFPVFELAKALHLWNGMEAFEYASMEADVSPLLIIETKGGFYLASPLSQTCSDTIVDRDSLLRCVRGFVETVWAEVAKRGIRCLK